jgi:lipid-A-disaccharide synthase-like uncharacterized protein
VNEPSGLFSAENLWRAFGITGAVIFYGRFYVQWIVSEIQKRSVIPVAFWYMSSAGSVMLLTYAVYLQSPLGALGQSLNIVIYSRNLVHIWREQGSLSKRRDVLIHAAVACIAVVAVVLVIRTWVLEYHLSKTVEAEQAVRNWIWLAIGGVGQALFACRFLVQWAVTEIKRKSVVPPIFWHLSVAASSLMMASFIQRSEWVFAVGMGATILIYLRNLWFIYKHHGEAVAKE